MHVRGVCGEWSGGEVGHGHGGGGVVGWWRGGVVGWRSGKAWLEHLACEHGCGPPYSVLIVGRGAVRRDQPFHHMYMTAACRPHKRRGLFLAHKVTRIPLARLDQPFERREVASRACIQAALGQEVRYLQPLAQELQLARPQLAPLLCATLLHHLLLLHLCRRRARAHCGCDRAPAAAHATAHIRACPAPGSTASARAHSYVALQDRISFDSPSVRPVRSSVRNANAPCTPTETNGSIERALMDPLGLSS